MFTSTKACRVALLALLALGCGPPPPSQFPTARAAIERMRATYACSRGISAEAKVDYFGDEGRVRGRTLLLMQRPEQVRFDVFSPFGVMLTTLTSDGQRFALLDVGQKAFFIGPANECNVQRFVRVPVPPHALVQLMSGEAPVLVHQAEQAAIGWESGQYVLRISSQRGAREEIALVPHPADWDKPWQEQRVRVMRVQVVQRGVELYEAEFRGHRSRNTAPAREDPDGLGLELPPSGPACSAEVPGRIKFTVVTSGQDVLFDYQQVQHNPPLPAQVFQSQPPRGVVIRRSDCQQRWWGQKQAAPAR